MANTKISALTSATTPLAGTEVLPIVQSGATVKVTVANLTAGRAISATTIQSTVATGTAPLIVASTTEVANLRAANATSADTANQVKSNATTGVLQVTGPAAASTRVMTVPDANFTAARTDAGQTFTGNQAINGASQPKATTTNGSTYALQATNSANTDLMSARSDGLVTMGTAANSPYNLTTGSAANMFVDSNGWVFRSTSSVKYKTDIQDSTHGLKEILALRSVVYRQKSLGPNGEIDEKIHGGLLAEDVDAAGLNEFVQYAKDGTPDALHYGNMVALLVKAVQEQQLQIDELKSKI